MFLAGGVTIMDIFFNVKQLYRSPFLTQWPLPLSFREILDCFRIKEASKKIKNIQSKIKLSKTIYLYKAGKKLEGINILTPFTPF